MVEKGTPMQVKRHSWNWQTLLLWKREFYLHGGSELDLMETKNTNDHQTVEGGHDHFWFQWGPNPSSHAGKTHFFHERTGFLIFKNDVLPECELVFQLELSSHAGKTAIFNIEKARFFMGYDAYFYGTFDQGWIPRGSEH